MANNMRRSHWCFTLNNPQMAIEDFTARLVALPQVRYAVWQAELGQGTEGVPAGTPHWQGYVELTRSQRMAWVRRNISDQAHWEVRIATRSQARKYCMKDDTRTDGPWEHGTWHISNQGQRTDIVNYCEDVKAGKRKRDFVTDNNPVLCKYPRYYYDIRSTIVPDIRIGLEVRLNYGDTGTGKTRYAYDTYGTNLYRVPISSTGLWMDGYDGQIELLIDDFSGAASKMTLNDTLAMLDIYPIQLPVKGSYTWLEAMVIIITTNNHPRTWYKWEDRQNQYPALMRRFTEIWWYKAGEEPEQVDMEDFRDNDHLYL